MSRDNEAVELLQHMIRNRCVNTNSPESGQEHRTVDLLRNYFDGTRLDMKVHEPAPGRQSLVVRIPGSDPRVPSLCLMGHTDVVPANENNWLHDPFAGELIDGFVWGRGAIDMLNLTATMAVTMKDLADSDFRPKGDLIFLAVADEESGGSLGAQWIADNAWADIEADYVLTEWGGVPMDSPTGPKLWITVGQKGGVDCLLTVRGTPGHASMPLGADNAVIKAAKVVNRIAEFGIVPEITDVWRQQVQAMEYDAELTALLLDPQRIDEGIAQMSPGMAKRAHACTRLTASPTVIHGGVKSNVIPDEVRINVLLRYLPNHSQEDTLASLREMLGELASEVEVDVRMHAPATSSAPHTPLWATLQQVATKLRPRTTCVPSLTPGGNDAGVFRARGSTAYGFGLLSNAISIEDFFAMFHGDNERIDVESLSLSREMWTQVARNFLS
jgi:acetylornithine deacetylase/succinyl-diaminopimelate desuccinylase-like protein